MEFHVHQDFSEFSEAEWNGLVEQSFTDTPFSRFEYLSQWWATRGGGEWSAEVNGRPPELVLVSARENGQLVGLAPLFLTEYDGQNPLMLVGSIEISDYLDLIVRESDLPRFLSGLLDFLGSFDAGNWSALDWYNLPDSSPTLAALNAEAVRRGWTYHEDVYRPTPRIPLNGSFEDYLARIDKKQRHEIRRKLRRAAESEKNVAFTIVNGTEDIDAEIDAFFDLMVQDPGKAEFLHPAMREQMTATIQSAHAHGYLWLAFLEVDGEKTAASLNFDYRNKLWGYNSGVSSEHRELSPGWVLLAHTIQWCTENDRYEFDFMRGDEEYKYRFGGVNKYVMRAKVLK
jgi:CelD/BcsL family acetyltransferase involved in cellulose biosynthesis